MSFLNRGQNDATPVGEGAAFEPSGMIAQWKSEILYSFMTQTDPGNLEADGMKPHCFANRGPDWFVVYYKTSVEGKAAMDALGMKGYNGKPNKPQQVWYLECNKSTILNLPAKSIEKFQSDTISADVRVMAKMSKHFHEMHFIALPKAVYAYAKLSGWDVPDVQFPALTRQFFVGEDKTAENQVDIFATKPTDYITKTYPNETFGGLTGDELYAKLCGKPDADKPDWECVYGKQRAALWAALDEPNPAKWHAKYKYDNKGNKIGLVEDDGLSTSSDKLDEALSVYIVSPWTLWARRVSVVDPRVDALDSKGKRLQLPVLWEFFKDKAEAQGVADTELKARADREAGKASVDGNKPPLPEVWKADEAGFVTCIKQYAGKPLPLAAKDLMVEVDELRSWKEYLKLQR